MNSKTYSNILFDLDGTLTDSGPGIMNGFAYAIGKMSGEVGDKSQLSRFVGPPLEDSFGRILGYSEEDTVKAIAFYREYYFGMGGSLENSVYPGIVELLSALKAAGKRLMIATSKSEKGTTLVLEHFDLMKYFDFVAASNDTDRKTKTDVIRYALKQCGISDLSSCVMVGDRNNDIEAAVNVGIDSIGVLYGYGSREELEGAGATYIVDTPSDIQSTVLA